VRIYLASRDRRENGFRSRLASSPRSAPLFLLAALDGARPNLHFPSVTGGVPFEIVNYGLARKARVYTRADLTKW